ncbi:hypothetical protein [Dinghuibacter silviterrae]|uniref:Uncharacterized protein n=1 Tax=Dinghuibacter silviterrae TaxID=1539049 RepID=A0A4R8DTU9_9BACT|nr:hypothetical protein [Dinghuibacter silviterrae]TDX01348.1 hypothetical protein EDB95_2382 [Dinghuibacter silviterrae]
MILRIVLILLSILGTTSGDLDRAGYYAVFAKGNLQQIDQELDNIRSIDFPGKEGFEGALLMRKAGKRSNVADKLSDFKAGGKKLEAAIRADSTNVEFRFLRLCIQENAPHFLGYHSDLDRDNVYVSRHFKQLTSVVQDAIRAYSQQSHVLKLDNQ